MRIYKGPLIGLFALIFAMCQNANDIGSSYKINITGKLYSVKCKTIVGGFVGIQRTPIDTGIYANSAVNFICSSPIGVYAFKSTLHFINILPFDRIMIYSLSGRIIREANGVSDLPIGALAPRPLLVKIIRKNAIASLRMVFMH